MEPLSIISGALSVAFTCACTLRDLKDAISKTEEVPQILSDLDRQMEMLSTVLSCLDERIRADSLHATSSSSAGIFQDQFLLRALEGCHGTLQRLHARLQKYQPLRGHVFGKLVKGLSAFWKENEIKAMTESIQKEQDHLQFVMITRLSFSLDFNNSLHLRQRSREQGVIHSRSYSQPFQIYCDGDSNGEADSPASFHMPGNILQEHQGVDMQRGVWIPLSKSEKERDGESFDIFEEPDTLMSV